MQPTLLPALPEAWAGGSGRGLRARGGFEIDIEWSVGTLQAATVRSNVGGPFRLRYRGNTVLVDTVPSETVGVNVGSLS